MSKDIHSQSFYDSISFELCKLYSSDQGIRERNLFDNTSNRIIQKIDSSNFSQLVNIIKLIGVPNAEKLGEENFSNECVEGAFGAILLHNPHILIEDQTKMDFFIALVKKGDLKPEALATILDKYYWSNSGGSRVIYGSQFGKPCKSDSIETNKLRVKIGLATLRTDDFKDCD
ncbi:hypothetical protein [Fulvivirga sp.]|uniref:hypothetical protein n=1 Tax=Fulvivirga sp. TaxID=1931237 RepID=UPI0032F030A6